MPNTPLSLFGVLFLIIGLVGFVSNPLIGMHALFATDTAHNVLHVLLGAALLAISNWFKSSERFWLKSVGVIVCLVGIIGLVTIPSSGGLIFGIAYANGALNWFNVVIGAGMVALSIYGD